MAEYIDREALLKRYRALANIDWNNKVSPPSWSYAYESFIDRLEELPTADVVPRAEVEGIFAEIEKIFGDAINGSAFYGMQYAELKKKHIKN